jgi:hypothetical protein
MRLPWGVAPLVATVLPGRRRSDALQWAARLEGVAPATPRGLPPQRAEIVRAEIVPGALF